jgi:hypothetical protein
VNRFDFSTVHALAQRNPPFRLMTAEYGCAYSPDA